jgi:hypothetical protein
MRQETQYQRQHGFFWRHKILSAVRANRFEDLAGIVEAEETTFLESDKGSRKITHRKPRKRGGKAKKRGLIAERVAELQTSYETLRFSIESRRSWRNF